MIVAFLGDARFLRTMSSPCDTDVLRYVEGPTRNPGTPFADRHGRASTKEIKTRQVLKKHKILK